MNVAETKTVKLRDMDFDPFGLSDEARSLMRGSMAPREFVEALRDKELLGDAIRFLANWLPRPAAIWWGTLCVWTCYRPTAPNKVADVFQAIVLWLQAPTDEHRRAAAAAGDNVGGDTPPGMLATAVFFSGGSISLPKLPVVEPPSFVTAKCVVNAIGMAAAQAGAENEITVMHNFIHMGLDVSEGKNLWTTSQA